MSKTLLFIGFVWPEPKSSAAGSRTIQLIEVFKNQGYQVTFASTANPSPNTFDLKSIGVNTKNIKLNHASFDEFLKQHQPDIVIFDRFMIEEQYGWRVTQYCPNAIRILDTIDLHFLRKGREAAHKNNIDFTKALLINDYTKREIASIYRCDLSLIISEFEMGLLKEKFNINTSLIFYLPFLLSPISTDYIQQLPKFKARQHLVTIGNFMHAPNYESIVYLKHKIWPELKQKLPEVELHIYGAYASEKVNNLHNKKDRFLLKGFTEDVNKVMMQARLCLAPLPFGAGLKGKLVDAMLNGTPMAMSSIAAEGMFDDKIPGFVADTPEDFVNKVAELYQNEALWNKKSEIGFDVISKRFDSKLFTDNFFQIIQYLEESLEHHRQQNFIGQMLLHHTLKSTKYLSKWIEEKEKTKNFKVP